MSEIRDNLIRVPLFDGLPEEDLLRVASIVVRKQVGRSQPIFAEGDQADGFYVVGLGRVKVFKLSPDGKEQIIHLLGPGEPFGEVPVFQGSVFPAHAEALEESELLFFPRPSFIALIKQNPSLALNMLAVLSRRLRGMAAMIENLALKEAPGRLAAYLLYLNDRAGGTGEVILDIPKTMLASLIGATPETLSRILAKLNKQGLIESEGPRIVIVDRPALDSLASEGKLSL